MSGTKYYLVEASILPKVYSGVIAAKRCLRTGEAKSVSAAVKMAGISRSAYYKYKDKILEYNDSDDRTATFSATLTDSVGVLSGVTAALYEAGANVLSVNQSVPVQGVADVRITVRLPEGENAAQDLLQKINNTDGVCSVNLL